MKDTVIRLRDLSEVKPDFELKQVVKNVLGEVVTGTAPALQATMTLNSRKPNVAASIDYLAAPIPPPLFKVSGVLQQVATRLT